MKSGIYKCDLMATKRNDPDYEQVSGYVHKDIALKFRIFCMTERLTQSDALEQALSFWIESQNSETDQPTEIDPATIPIEELQLSFRAHNCLKRAQINSVAELLTHTPQSLLEIKNVGQSTVDEVVARLQKLGFSLAPEPEPAEPETTAKPTAATKPAAATAKRGKASKSAS